MTFSFCHPLESRTFLCTDLSTAPMDHASTMTVETMPLSAPTGEQRARLAKASSKARKFSARLNGSNEVPDRTTPAKGNATFTIDKRGRSIAFNVTVSDLRNVVAAHLHLGKADQNGGVVVQLFGPVSPNGGLRNGRLARGKITAQNLTGALAGQPLSALIQQIRSANVYINIHTDDGAGETDTGPGDFASGEIRGQLKTTKKGGSSNNPGNSNNPPTNNPPTNNPPTNQPPRNPY